MARPIDVSEIPTAAEVAPPTQPDPRYNREPMPSDRRFYAESMVIYSAVALAAILWGVFTVGAGAGILGQILTPAPHPGVPASSPQAGWIGFTLFAMAVFATFAAVLGYGTILGLKTRSERAKR